MTEISLSTATFISLSRTRIFWSNAAGFRTEDSPKESRFRPSIDALFRSAALAYGRRVIGILLTGMNYDGAAGLWEIKKHGGLAIVQAPSDAEHPEMPLNAMDNVEVDLTQPKALARR